MHRSSNAFYEDFKRYKKRTPNTTLLALAVNQEALSRRYAFKNLKIDDKRKSKDQVLSE